MTARPIVAKDREDLLRHVRLSYWKILNRLDKTLERSSLTARQFLLLNALGESGSMNARKLGEVLSVTPADVTGLTARLERKGLVRRTRSEADRRLVILELTDSGAAALEAARRDRDQLIDSLITSMSPQEFRTMVHGLSRLIHTLGGGSDPVVEEGVEAFVQARDAQSASEPKGRKRRPFSRRSPSPGER